MALGAAGLTQNARAVEAPSSVTLYGIVDAALQYGKFDKGVGASAALASGNLQASRLGFRGSEDLGAGYRANFQLETGFSIDTGVGGGTTLFNRGAAVGLSSADYGSIDVGSLYLPIYWVFLGSDVATYGLANPSAIMSLEHSSTLGKSGTGGFYSNAIRYRTPVLFNGLTSEIGYSFGAEDSSNLSNGRNIGMNLQYARGPVTLGYGVNRHRYDPGTAAASLPNISQLTQVVAATFNVGGNMLGANYLYSKRTDPGAWFSSAVMLNARIATGPGDINLGVSRRAQQGDARATAYSAGYVYFLSKRTQLYGYATRIVNNGRSTQGFGLLSPASATVTPGFDPWAVTAGLRTSF
nr:porin [Herbaspirillum sp. LeCh32-8]